MNGEETINPVKWSRRAAVASFGAACFIIFAAIFMWLTKLRITVVGISPPPIFWIPMFARTPVVTLYATVFAGGVLAAFGGLLSWRRKFYGGAIGVTIFSFILGGSFFSLLALAFLLAAKKEFAQKVELVT